MSIKEKIKSIFKRNPDALIPGRSYWIYPNKSISGIYIGTIDGISYFKTERNDRHRDVSVIQFLDRGVNFELIKKPE